jgi:type IV secretory pathway TrbD component
MLVWAILILAALALGYRLRESVCAFIAGWRAKRRRSPKTRCLLTGSERGLATVELLAGALGVSTASPFSHRPPGDGMVQSTAGHLQLTPRAKTGPEVFELIDRESYLADEAGIPWASA